MLFAWFAWKCHDFDCDCSSGLKNADKYAKFDNHNCNGWSCINLDGGLVTDLENNVWHNHYGWWGDVYPLSGNYLVFYWAQDKKFVFYYEAFFVLGPRSYGNYPTKLKILKICLFLNGKKLLTRVTLIRCLYCSRSWSRWRAGGAGGGGRSWQRFNGRIRRKYVILLYIMGVWNEPLVCFQVWQQLIMCNSSNFLSPVTLISVTVERILFIFHLHNPHKVVMCLLRDNPHIEMGHGQILSDLELCHC